MKKIYKKVIILIVIICILVFFLYKIFFQEKIYSNKMNVWFYSKKLDTDRLLGDINASEDFWQIHDWVIRNDNFNYVDNKSNIDTNFCVTYEICFDESLENKIENIGYEIQYTDEQNEMCMFSYDSDDPFETIGIRQTKEGILRISVEGLMGNKPRDEVIRIMKKIEIIVYVKYKNGKTEEKKIRYNNAKIVQLIDEGEGFFEPEYVVGEN